MVDRSSGGSTAGGSGGDVDTRGTVATPGGAVGDGSEPQQLRSDGAVDVAAEPVGLVEAPRTGDLLGGGHVDEFRVGVDLAAQHGEEALGKQSTGGNDEPQGRRVQRPPEVGRAV